MRSYDQARNQSKAIHIRLSDPIGAPEPNDCSEKSPGAERASGQRSYLAKTSWIVIQRTGDGR